MAKDWFPSGQPQIHSPSSTWNPTTPSRLISGSHSSRNMVALSNADRIRLARMALPSVLSDCDSEEGCRDSSRRKSTSSGLAMADFLVILITYGSTGSSLPDALTRPLPIPFPVLRTFPVGLAGPGQRGLGRAAARDRRLLGGHS